MEESNRQSEQIARRLIQAGWPALGRVAESKTSVEAASALEQLADLRRQLDRVRVTCGQLAERFAAREQSPEPPLSCARFDLRPAATKVFDAGRQFFDAQRAAIIVRDDLGRWECLAARGLTTAFLDVVLADPEAVPPLGSALALEEPAFATDLPDLMRETALGPAFGQERIVGALAVPLFQERDVVGCVVYFHDQSRRYTPAEIDLAASLARYLATMIDDARRYLDAELLGLGFAR